MNDLSINTKKNKIGINDISNVYPFTSISGNTNVNFISNSTCYTDKKDELLIQNKSTNYYTINLDWFQFVCRTDKNGSVLESCSNDRITIKKIQTNYNPNFRFRYTVMLDNGLLCEIFAVPNNNKHKKNEILVKINNAQLYTVDWTIRIYFLLNELGFAFTSLTRIDIAIDGSDLYKKMDLFRRYLRNKTITINNENLDIDGVHFNKSKHNWGSYTIGSKKYQKTAEIYNKTSEIKVSGKDYITEFWNKNGLNIKDKDEVGRFELKLGTRHLKKYKVSSFNDFCDAGYLGKILADEVHNWLKFYQVSLTDIKTHRKDIALKKGKELKFIFWDKVPQTTIQLEKVNCVSDGIQEAKRSITHVIGEIQKGYTIDSTETLIKFVEATTTEYQIFNHTGTKIKAAINNNPTMKIELESLLIRLAANSKVNFIAGIIENNNTKLD